MQPGKCGCPGNPNTPFGGPASGLWPNGFSGPASAATPATCRQADLIATCFTGCVGATPCGFFPATAPGTVQFAAGQVFLGNNGSGDSLGLIVRQHAAGFDALNATMQFKLTQFPDPPSSGGSNTAFVTDATGIAVFRVQLFDDGTLFTIVGNNRFNGAWTPTPGGEVIVHYFTESGVPRLFLNGEEVALVAAGIQADFFFPNLFFIGSETPVANSKSAFDYAFVDRAPIGPSVIFCCPDGVPSQ